MNCGGERSYSKPKVVIFVAPKDNVRSHLERFLEFLKGRGWSILQVIDLGSKPEKSSLKQCDVIITLGGDGTILYAAREIEGFNKPILGINFGKIGLLTELTLEGFFDNVENIENGKYSVSKVNRIEAIRVGSNEKFPSVLNEYVIMTRSPGKILGLDVYVDGELFSRVLCDGLIIATPTGSSSYALSAGGPVVLESVKSFILVPIAPLFRTTFPVVLPPSSIIRILVRKEWMDALLIADGVISGKLARGEEIMIRYSDATTSFIRFGSKYSRLKKVIGMVSLKYG